MDTKELQIIIKKCVKGKREAQHQLFKLYSNKMYAISLYYSKNKTDAEDILHSGFLKVFEKISQFKGTGPFDAWIRRIFVNTALEQYRKSNLMYSVGDATEYEIEDRDADIISKISSEDLMMMVHELSPIYKLVFNLYAIEGYSHKEISEMLEIAEGTSKSNLSRARKILQEKVRNHFQITERKTQ